MSAQKNRITISSKCPASKDTLLGRIPDLTSDENGSHCPILTHGNQNAQGIPGTRNHGGFTLVEMLVGVLVLAILVALIFPSVRAVLEGGKRAGCVINMRSMLGAWGAWSADGNAAPETAESSPSYNSPTIISGFDYASAFIPTYLTKELRCPSVPSGLKSYPLGFRYAFFRWNKKRMVNWPVPSSRIVVVSEMYYFADGCWAGGHQTSTFNGMQSGSVYIPPQRHGPGLHFGFLDGHIELVVPGLDGAKKPDFSYPPVYARNLKEGFIFGNTQVAHIQNGRTSW